MSIKCTSRVWDQSAVGGTELLVLLAISDYAHDDGSGAWPSIKTLASKCKVSPMTIKRITKKLKEQGEIDIQYGAGPMGTNLYTVLSGLGGQPRRFICYLCSEEEDGTIAFEEHHIVPGDDSTKVKLCKPCHIKLHALLLGGNKVIPPRGSQSDTPRTISEGGDIIEGQGGIIAMIPDPLLDPLLDPQRDNLWLSTLTALKGTMAKETFEAHLQGSTAIQNDGMITVTVRRKLSLPWCERLRPKVASALTQVAGHELALAFTTEEAS